MDTAISELVLFLESRIWKEKDPAEREELCKTLLIARKIEEKRRKPVCA